jgi:hypothetical protein
MSVGLNERGIEGLRSCDNSYVSKAMFVPAGDAIAAT